MGIASWSSMIKSFAIATAFGTPIRLAVPSIFPIQKEEPIQGVRCNEVAVHVT